MDDKERIIALERELEETRRSAVMIILSLTEAIAETPQAREDLAQTFEDFADEAWHVSARLARLVAAAVRRG